MGVLTESKVRRATVMLPTDGGAGDVQLAATIVADASREGPRVVCFAFPGGGYGRHYFDIQHPELAGPSEAAFHAAAGVVFVACDPYGGGDSTELPEEERGLDETVEGVDAAVRYALQALADGSLVDWLEPLEIGACIAVGHSLGGMQLVAHQGRRARFEAVAILGWSSVHTQTPTPNGFVAPTADLKSTRPTSLDEAWAGPMVDAIANMRYAYHWDDVSPQIVAEDMGVGFPIRTAATLPSWTTRTFPPFAAICMSRGVVAGEAAAIEVPVFVALGQRDVSPGLHEEALAYRGSIDLTLVELPRSAHMHNFSPQRELLWVRLQTWIDSFTTLVRRG
jgi:pimeloyl-ACP methyl ester carboxylesterase